jgi:hypothetical protein
MRTNPPKQLEAMTDFAGFMSAWIPMVPPLPDNVQTITVYPPPAFLFCKGMRAYWAKDIFRFKGYLSKFEFKDANINPKSNLDIENKGDGFNCTITYQIGPLEGPVQEVPNRGN